MYSNMCLPTSGRYTVAEPYSISMKGVGIVTDALKEDGLPARM